MDGKVFTYDIYPVAENDGVHFFGIVKEQSTGQQAFKTALYEDDASAMEACLDWIDVMRDEYLREE